MFSHDAKSSNIIAGLQFCFKGKQYKGRGALKWNPKKGFRVEGPLSGPDVKRIEFRHIGAIPRDERPSIRMLMTDGSKVWLPYSQLGSVLLIHAKYLDSACSTAVRIVQEPQPVSSSNEYWFGDAVYQGTDHFGLFDANDHKAEFYARREKRDIPKTRFYEGEDGTWIQVDERGDHSIQVHWKLNKASFTRAASWHFAHRLQLVLKLLHGQTVGMLERSTLRGQRRISQYFKHRPIKSLHDYLLFFEKPYGGVNKHGVVNLVRRFLEDEVLWIVANRCISRVASALEQELAGQELLVSATLEGILRTLTTAGRLPRRRRWQLEHSLEAFTATYLNPQWEPIALIASKSFHRLRNNMAHPDWARETEAGYSDALLNRSLTDQRFLCRFYGYMLLALAGVKNLEPKFPPPVQGAGHQVAFRE
ncbi:MAG: hypothetical protein ACR2IE_04285 [Candidatus Sumerlaeaceae bacterium]